MPAKPSKTPRAGNFPNDELGGSSDDDDADDDGDRDAKGMMDLAKVSGL